MMDLQRFAKFAAMKNKRSNSIYQKILVPGDKKNPLGVTSEGTIPPGSGVEPQSQDLAASRSGR